MNFHLEIDKKVPEEHVFKHQYPWQVVVELTKMQRNLSYQDIYQGLAYLMRPCMAFYNHFIEGKVKSDNIIFNSYYRRMFNWYCGPSAYSEDAWLSNSITNILYCESSWYENSVPYKMIFILNVIVTIFQISWMFWSKNCLISFTLLKIILDYME